MNDAVGSWYLNKLLAVHHSRSTETFSPTLHFFNIFCFSPVYIMEKMHKSEAGRGRKLTIKQSFARLFTILPPNR